MVSYEKSAQALIYMVIAEKRLEKEIQKLKAEQTSWQEKHSLALTPSQKDLAQGKIKQLDNLIGEYNIEMKENLDLQDELKESIYQQADRSLLSGELLLQKIEALLGQTAQDIEVEKNFSSIEMRDELEAFKKKKNLK